MVANRSTLDKFPNGVAARIAKAFPGKEALATEILAEPKPSCPDCGKPYGKIRRCYACKPGVPMGRAGRPRREAEAPPAPATHPSIKPAGGNPLDCEIDAMRAIATALAPFDLTTRAAALDWAQVRLLKREG